ncbi:MAG: translation initiation factor IF-2 N-terminal domain-containing protein, partial [Solirubrobacterales bacterium]|nr:translation initiation factor IF-2 N-terminal domain-containing protein [Solirubrobacterales bacterium]
MNKRVHQIAKEQGLSTKQALERLRAAGLNVKASSSTVDEEAALRALGNGGGGSTAQPAPGGGSAAQSAPGGGSAP